MKYYMVNKEDYSDKQEITYEKALDILLGTWKDNDMTRDMLTIPNWINCQFSIIAVEKHCGDGDITVLMAGLANEIPCDYAYDVDGNRKWKRVQIETVAEDGRITRHHEWQEIA